VNRRPAPAEAGIPFKPRDTLKTAEEQVRWSTMLLFDGPSTLKAAPERPVESHFRATSVRGSGR
jgi:hypothetical protein